MEKKSGDYEAFNVGTGNARSIKSIGEDLGRLLGKNIDDFYENLFKLIR